MKINWQPIETRPKDEMILCAEIIDGGQQLEKIGIFKWSTDDKWRKHWATFNAGGLWLQAGQIGCDGCWREQHHFTHWAPLPVSKAHRLRAALLKIRQLPDENVSMAKVIAREAMAADANDQI